MTGSNHNVFISHVHEDDHHVHGFRDLLNRNGHNVRNSSIDSTRPNNATNEEYIKYKILKPKIIWAGKMIVLIGPSTHQSPWVNWEIEQAHKQGMTIVGVFLRGAKASDVPENLTKYGHATVGWNSEKIMDAIDGEHTGWCVPRDDGTFEDTGSTWKLDRHGC